MVQLACYQLSDTLKRADQAISVNVPEVLNEQHVDGKVHSEHPPVEGVERPAHPLLPIPSDHDSEQARVHEYHGHHEARVGQGQHPEVQLQPQVAAPRLARLLLVQGGVARQAEAVAVVDRSLDYTCKLSSIISKEILGSVKNRSCLALFYNNTT